MDGVYSRGADAAGTTAIGGDLVVNRLGFGAMRVTGKGVWGEPPDRGRAVAVIRRAVELGVDLFDTADSYGPGVSEELLAEALSPYPNHIVIATKGGFERPGPNQWVCNGRPEHLVRACEESMARLRLDPLPLYQLHHPDPAVPFEESVGALAELAAAGKIRHVGLSNVTGEQLQTARGITPIASVQNRFTLRDRRSSAVMSTCEQAGIAFLPWAPVHDAEDAPSAIAIAARRGVSVRQLALAWMLALSPAIVPIPGTGRVDHLEENVAAATITLDAAELAALARERGEDASFSDE